MFIIHYSSHNNDFPDLAMCLNSFQSKNNGAGEQMEWWCTYFQNHRNCQQAFWSFYKVSENAKTRHLTAS